MHVEITKWELKINSFLDMYTLLPLKWITNKDLLYSTWTSVPCYVAAWMGGEFGGEWVHVRTWLSPFAVHLQLSEHCLLIGYAPIRGSQVAQWVRNLPAVQETRARSQGQKDPLEEGMATCSSILAWRIPRADLDMTEATEQVYPNVK